jgi:tRNA (cytidine/uridine-2'-O-)-methyltransferase
LGIELSDRYLKRAGLDYWPHVNLHYHPDLESFSQVHRERGGNLLGFSVRGAKNYLDYAYKENDWLIFGSETEGIPLSFLEQCDARLYIKMAQPHVRSLNLSVSVAIGLFEARRQLGLQS